MRAIGRRVKRWQSGTMVLRWTAAAGYRALPILVAALRAHALQFNRPERRLDDTENAA